MAQVKLYEVQNQLKSLDYIEFRGLLDMVRVPDPRYVDDKGSKAPAFSQPKTPPYSHPYKEYANTMSQFGQGLPPDPNPDSD